ncbi:MAG TPA: DnaB-like helicase N-terminal domain-containing protein, partial [Acidovorax sp.]|nr:DnaB-like helicase N-terminal domain-containing protein [Acidovorax sp.]
MDDFDAHHEVAQLRVPPHSIEAESAVLGALLLDNGAWDHIGDLLAESDFYRHEHRTVFAAISSMVNACQRADVVSVYAHLQNLGKAAEVGGLVYLNQLAQYVPSAANVRRFAEIVRERAVMRRLVAVGDEIATAAFNPQGRSAAELMDEVQQKVFNVAEAGISKGDGFQNWDRLVVGLLDHVQEMSDKPEGELPGTRTGFSDLDRMTSGLNPGDLIVLAGRPSMGKTAFAINVAEHIALEEGLPVAVFSMEMGAGQLALRIAGSLGRINQTNLRT